MCISAGIACNGRPYEKGNDELNFGSWRKEARGKRLMDEENTEEKK